MKIHFHGATGDVTGSAYHVVTKHASVMVDCGMFQGGKTEKAKNRREAKLEGGKLDAVLLTHGHLDHIGRLPLLTRKGYEGPIFATQPTIDIATLILRDSLSLQKADLKRKTNGGPVTAWHPWNLCSKSVMCAGFGPWSIQSSITSASRWRRESRRDWSMPVT